MLEQLYYIPTDKLLHIIIGMMLSMSIIYLLDELNIKTKFLLWLILGVALDIGILKESYDTFYKSGWDNIDLLYTLIGSTFPYLIKKFIKFSVKLFGRKK